MKFQKQDELLIRPYIEGQFDDADEEPATTSENSNSHIDYLLQKIDSLLKQTQEEAADNVDDIRLNNDPQQHYVRFSQFY